MHPVKIDEEGIGAAFDAAAAGLDPATPGAAPMVESAPPPGESWEPVTRIAASILAAKVCPAWEVDQETQAQWADALGECLEQLMPGGLGNIDAWGPWAKLAFASSMWIMAGFDPETLSLKPRHHLPPADGQKLTPTPGVFTTDA